MYEIYVAIQNSKNYFYKFCGTKADEAMHLTLFHALTHYREDSGDLGAYVRSLARTILRDRYFNVVTPVDFLEETVTLDSVSSDIANQVIDSLAEEECYEKVVELALTSMGFFVQLCNSLKTKDTSTLYFPDYFTAECLKLQSTYSSFYKVCLSLYNMYKSDFEKFLLEDSGSNWSEANFTLIKTRTSPRVALISSKTGKPSVDPDTENCVVSGVITNKHIISIPYVTQLDRMCNLIDAEEINVVRFTIGDNYIIKTLGGSLSVLNPSLFNMYSLCEAEILTNLLKETNGRYLGKGSKSMYFLVNEIPTVKTKIIRGMYMSFDVRVEL